MTTLRVSLRLDVERSTPMRHHFHSLAQTGNAGLDGINQRLVEARQMYVRFGDDDIDLCLAGTPDELRAWAARLCDYVDAATADHARQEATR